MMERRFMLEVILNFLSNTYVGQNIARPRQNDWFHTIYYEQYRSLFFYQSHYSFLDSTTRTPLL